MSNVAWRFGHMTWLRASQSAEVNGQRSPSSPGNTSAQCVGKVDWMPPVGKLFLAVQSASLAPAARCQCLTVATASWEYSKSKKSRSLHFKAKVNMSPDSSWRKMFLPQHKRAHPFRPAVTAAISSGTWRTCDEVLSAVTAQLLQILDFVVDFRVIAKPRDAWPFVVLLDSSQPMAAALSSLCGLGKNVTVG